MLDFFSKLSEFNIMVVSLRFLRCKVSINFKILSVALLIIINLCCSKRDLDKILSIYPSEDDIVTMIHAENGQSTWKILEDIDTVTKRINE